VLRRLVVLILGGPRRTLAMIGIALVGLAIFGAPVVKELSVSGFEDPATASSQAKRILLHTFGRSDAMIVFTLHSEAGADSDSVRSLGIDIVNRLQRSGHVGEVMSLWTAPAANAQALLSEDGKTGLIAASLIGNDVAVQEYAQQFASEFAGTRGGVTITAGGNALASAQIRAQSQKDLLVMESIAIPAVFAALVWVFGGLVAAAVPLAVGSCAIVGSLAVLRFMTSLTDVSIFALNLSIALGLALAIDYSLLILSRFREELKRDNDQRAALIRTIPAAGRTVIYSAIVVALSMAAMVLFPMSFLKSFAYAGVAVVVFACLAVLVVTPALIAVLGDRLNAYDIRRLRRRQSPVETPVEESFWYRSTKFAMRHSIAVVCCGIALLLFLGSPFLRAAWGFFDDRVLPTSASARQVGDQMRGEFAIHPQNDITIVIPDAQGLTVSSLDDYASTLSRIPEVITVSSPGQRFVNGLPVGPPSAPAAIKNDKAFLTIASKATLYSAQSAAQLDRIEATRVPDGRHALVTGTAAMSRDNTSSILARTPAVLTVIAAVMLALLFLLTRSVILPLKALLLNGLTMTATFGALVWVFQEGHLGGLGTSTTGTLVIHTPMLLFCIAFGLSMDYEVFLISRIREYWQAAPHPDAADNDECVALGLARTGRVVTAAALIMTLSFAALLGAKVAFMRMCGLGLSIAVLMDATLVRMLLLPAFMHLLGRANWWAPALLRGRDQRCTTGQPSVPQPK
jgi:uncharacterized membrane protein YdfJ with MMPL/SSD domain